MTVTIEINNIQYLSALGEFLTRNGLKFEVDDDWGELSNLEVKVIKAGMDDFKNGRVVSHEDAMVQLEDHIGNPKINPHI